MRIILAAIFLLFTIITHARVILPSLFSDHMVMQRNKEIRIWGTTSGELEIEVVFDGQKIKTEVENDKWVVFFDARPEGGPYTLSVKGSNTVTISDVMIGDVFVCGGQSNMEWSMKDVNNAEKELEDANFPEIRLFTVPQDIRDAKTLDLAGGQWTLSDPSSVADFSAIGFLVARQLYKEYKVPIGLIDNSWGGTNIAGWMPEEAFANQGKFEEKIKEFKDLHCNEKSFSQAKKDWAEELELSDNGLYQGWSEPDFDKSAWKTIKAPGLWEEQGFPNKDGFFWMSKKVTIPVIPEEKPCKIGIAKIDDADMTYVNGLLIGSTNGYNDLRVYDFSTDHLRAGINEITIRIKDTGGGGGIHGMPSDMYLSCESLEKIPLEGDWLIAEGSSNFQPLSATYDANAYPTNRYNGMVHPLTQYPIAAYLFYQGEADTWQAKTYESLFQNMIRSYRSAWKDNQLPFVFVQLANFMAEDKEAVESEWADLRAAQTAALKLPYTAMVSAIDIGNADDIHPRDKQTVGSRTVACLKRLVYNTPNIYTGPTIDKVRASGMGILVTFNVSGEGLIIKGNEKAINGFVIETIDGRLIKIPGIKQSATSILLDYEKPIKSVRYLWANNPGKVQIYNMEGFPVNPFMYKL